MKGGGQRGTGGGETWTETNRNIKSEKKEREEEKGGIDVKPDERMMKEKETKRKKE